MSDQIRIPANEHGVVRLFALDLPEAEAEAFAAPAETGPWPLAEAMQAAHLEPDHVALLRLDDLEGIGLAGYLTDGLGLAPEEVAESRPLLDPLKGHVVIVTSPAFGGQAQELVIRRPLRHVATWREAESVPPMDKLRSDSAQGRLEGAAGLASAPKQGRWATLLLLGILALLALGMLLAFVGG